MTWFVGLKGHFVLELLLVVGWIDHRGVDDQHVVPLTIRTAVVANLDDPALPHRLGRLLFDVVPALANVPCSIDEGVVRLGWDLESLARLGFPEGVSHRLRPYA